MCRSPGVGRARRAFQCRRRRRSAGRCLSNALTPMACVTVKAVGETEQPALPQPSRPDRRAHREGRRRVPEGGLLASRVPWGNYTWAGVKALKGPWDIWITQEILWRPPDLVVETGVHEGGSTLFYAQMLDLIGHGEVLAVDIDLSTRPPGTGAPSRHAHRGQLGADARRGRADESAQKRTSA